MLNKLILILVLSSCAGIPSAAQDVPLFFEKLTTGEGLSSNKITDILQDDDGFIWIATTDGLNRFDGTEIQQYFQDGNTNSLSHNYIFCLKKLPGHIAIATQAGLSFFDLQTGVFKNFYYDKDTAFAKYNNAFISLEIDSYGNLWAASRNCIFIFNTGLGLERVIRSPFTKQDEAKFRLKFVDKFIPLSNGKMIVYRFDGVYIYTASSHKGIKVGNPKQPGHSSLVTGSETYRLASKMEQSYPAASVYKVFGKYLLCLQPGEDSIDLLDETGKIVERCFFPYNKYPLVSWSHQLGIIDSSRLLFFFHNFGFAQISVVWKDNKPSFSGVSKIILEEEEFVTGMRDRQGNWWLATSGSGLRKASPYKQYFKGYELTDREGERLKSEMVSISRYGNMLWIATYIDGFYGMNLNNKKLKQFLISTSPDNPWPNFVWNVRQLSKDTLWVGTQEGLYWYNLSNNKYGRIKKLPGKPDVIDSVSITMQYTDSHGLTWMGLGKGNGVCYYDNKNHRFVYYSHQSANAYPFRYPTQIAEDNKGNIWFISDASTSLVRWVRMSNKFEVIKLPAYENRISDLSALWCESDSVIWVGTIASGLIRFNVSSNTIKIYGHDRGIADSHVNSIYRDDSNRTWIATNGSLSFLDPETEMITNYTYKDGLPVDFPTAFFYYDKTDRLLYGGGHGALFSLDPLGMDPPQSPQRTIITAMEVNGKPFLFRGEVARFKPSQNDITIRYTAIDFVNGPETKYAYKLIGEDTAWVMAGNQRQINFGNLAPGNYTFKVRASNSTGIWSSEEATVQFYIRKPFSQTTLFYLLIVSAIGGLFYALYHFRLRQLMRTEQIRSEISKNLHDEVGSALTNISLGTLLAQKQLKKESSVNRILERIYQDSQNVSQSMREIVWSINPKIDTLGEAIPRMLHYASELLEAKDIELRANVEPEISHVKLSMQQRRDLYLIFKETVNNLAKHSSASMVEIRLYIENNILYMVISDNGVGFDPSSTFFQNGLRNMRERAASHKWNLNLETEQGEGTTITLKARIA